MGAYLSSPICEKETIQGSNEHLAFAASSMQGWRISQEDAHNAILNYDEKTSFFAVYDGHGGAEIALYCSRHLPDFIKQLESYRQGRMNDALTEGFLQFDSLLLEPNVKEILKVLAEEKEKNDNDDADDENDDSSKGQSHNIVLPDDADGENHLPDELNAEEAQLLKKEATLPLEELLKRYGDKTNDQGKHFHSPAISKRTKENPLKNIEKKTEDNHEGDSAGSEGPTVDPNEMKSDVVSHADEENIPGDDTLDQKMAETGANGETTDTTDAQPSSSEPKSTTRRARKVPASTETTPSTAKKSKSLTQQLISGNLDEIDDDDDEDDFEFNASEEESSADDENQDDDEDEEAGEGEEDDDDDYETEEDDEDEEEEDEQTEKLSKSSKATKMQKLMRKSIMAILNRSSKKKKRAEGSGDDDEHEDDLKENQGDDDDDNDDEEQDEDDDDDDDDADLGQMLDMNNDPGSSSGCTAVVALVRDKQLYVANAGDSRCVVCRAGRAIEMSIDHKPEDIQEKSRIEKAGYKVTLDGRVSGGLNLSRAIGDHAYKKTASLPAEEQAITALPDIRTLTLDDSDEFMVIACDGIWNSMSSQEVVDFVRPRLDKKSLSEICEELFTHCLAPNTSGDGTGCDNMTAIIVKFNFKHAESAKSDKSEALQTNERSPWPSMFTSATNKRALSPDRSSSDGTSDENNSKKVKVVLENGNNESASPVKTAETFSFLTAGNSTTTNSNEDQHQ